MKKTSVYLEEAHLERLKRCAEREERSQAEVLREAILRYTQEANQPRRFGLHGIAEGPGGSVADSSQEELLGGFGQ
ncbi:MAG: CopG family transcriptional regulator [Chloroflexi bacterium]|nr:CopG family transcriptional regulator [Chloroflexota bacterium]